MKFTPTPLEGAFLIDLEKRGDERGFFGRLYCQKEFEAKNLTPTFVQVNNSLSKIEGTLRGLHYQVAPKAEDKLVRCIRGSIWDVILDLRPTSATYGQWYGYTLTAENRTMMYVPKGFAHGFVTLESDSEILYFVSEFYSPEHERCVRWDDPSFKIRWPKQPKVISEKDAKALDYKRESV